MGAGRIIGGSIILIILGIIIYGVSDWANTQTSYQVDRCISSLGDLNGFSQDTYEYCENITIGNSLSKVGIVVAVIFFIIGFILIIVGSIEGKRDKKIVKENIENPPNSVDSSKDTNEIKEKIDQSYTPIQEIDKPIKENNMVNLTKEEKHAISEYLSRLEKLGEMKKNGTLREEEFNILKGNILKKFDNVTMETTKSDSQEANNKSKERLKDSEI
jgi:preprotein translocase subunit SecG